VKTVEWEGVLEQKHFDLAGPFSTGESGQQRLSPA